MTALPETVGVSTFTASTPEAATVTEISLEITSVLSLLFVSLTVTETDDSGFGVSLIPHTAKMTTLGYKSAGDAVNLETDILARYVEKMLGMDKKGNGFAGRHKPGAAENNNSEPELTEAFLLRHGF